MNGIDIVMDEWDYVESEKERLKKEFKHLHKKGMIAKNELDVMLFSLEKGFVVSFEIMPIRIGITQMNISINKSRIL